MRRLLWKEWRERAVWVLPWAAATIITAVLGVGLRPCGPGTMLSPWMALPPALALLAGLGAFSSEQVGSRASFLYSRALSWKQVLSAKVLFGLLAALGIGLLAALACRLLLPATYHPFMTPANLSLGVLETAGLALSAYLIGLCCSIVLPGPAGGLLVLLLWLGAGIMSMQLAVYLQHDADQLRLLFVPVAMLLAPVPTAVIIARFGLTLHATARFLRFALVLPVLITTGFLLDHTPLAKVGQRYCEVLFHPTGTTTLVSVSPSGSFACAREYAGGPVRGYWILRADGRRLPLPAAQEYTWLEGDLLLACKDTSDHSGRRDLQVFWWDGRLESRLFSKMKFNRIYPSPDRKTLLLVTYHDLKLIHLDSGDKRVLKNINAGGTIIAWWESDTVIGYLERETGQRRFIDVRTLPEPAASEGEHD